MHIESVKSKITVLVIVGVAAVGVPAFPATAATAPMSNPLEGPTSAVLQHGKLYLASAAFITHVGPNILVADIDTRGLTEARDR